MRTQLKSLFLCLLACVEFTSCGPEGSQDGVAASKGVPSRTLDVQKAGVGGLNLGSLPRLDTNLVREIWKRDVSNDQAKNHKEAVEEFLTLTASVSTAVSWLKSEEEIAFLSGRMLVALSKLDMKNWNDRYAYRQLIVLSFFGKERCALAEAAYRWGDLNLLKNSVSYVGKRLFYLANIAWQLDHRYTYDLTGHTGRIPNPTPHHPSNKKLLTLVQEAVILFRDAKQASFHDRTLESAIKLALASLKMDNVEIDSKLEMEFWHARQVYVDALREALETEKIGFSWFDLAHLGFIPRGIETLDCLFYVETNEALKQNIEFLRADLERCKTNKPSGEKDLSVQEFRKFIDAATRTNTPRTTQ